MKNDRTGFARLNKIVALVATGWLLFASQVENSVAQEKPHIVFIMADDLGFGELGCYGQEKIKTPNIDALAEQGMRFTQHYCGAPVCAPSRCVLLTGQHLGHAEIRNNRDSGNGRIFPGQYPITDEIVTIAEVLKDAGYRTGAFGKWGLGPSNSEGSPNKQGFDRYFGYNCQRLAHSFFPPFLDSDEREVRINKYPVPGHDQQPEGEVRAEDYRAETYAPDRILNEAVKFIKNNKDNPMFLYLPLIEPHVAMHPPQEWIDRYPEEWDEEHGEYRGENGYLPHPRPRAGYAAMISDLDEHVGTIMKTLEANGMRDNTIVIFTSDNGPTHAGRNDPRWHVGGAACKFFNSNGGLRGYKGSCYEGGIRVPCIVKWPGQVSAGTESDVPSYFPDWFVTLAAIGSGELPDQQLDGIDLTGLLKGGDAPTREAPMLWDFGGYGGIAAIRDGKWKAVRTDLKNKNGPGQWQLFDIETDPAEQKDLAGSHPEVVEEIERKFRENRTVEDDFNNPIYDSQRN